MLEVIPLQTVDSVSNLHTFPYSSINPDAQPVNPLSVQDDRLRLLEEKLSQHQKRAGEIEQEAYEKAYAEGEKVGLELGGKRAQQILAQMQQILDDTTNQLAEIREHASDAIIDISGAIAEWIVGEITDKEHERLLQIARDASRKFPGAEPLKIALHPDDLTSVQRLPADSEQEIPLISDESMTPGCVRIFTRSRDALLDPHACVEDFLREFKLGLRKISMTEDTGTHSNTNTESEEKLEIHQDAD